MKNREEPTIQFSPFGMRADRNQWEFSCSKLNGRVDLILVSKYCWIGSRMGANSIRFIPALFADMNYKGSVFQTNHAPFIFENGAYRLSKLNKNYFLDLTQMILCALRNLLVPQITIGDNCHFGKRIKRNPFILNHEGISTWYDFNEYFEAYVEAVLIAVDNARILAKKENLDFDVMFELANEPVGNDFNISGLKILEKLFARNYKKSQIEFGIQYLPGHIEFTPDGKLKRTELHESFKKTLRNNGLYSGEDGDKEEYIYTLHNPTETPELLREIMIAVSSTLRRFKLSFDGRKPKPTAKEVYDIMYPLLKLMYSKAKGLKMFNLLVFETLYRGLLDGSSKLGDSMYGLEGFSLAYRDVTGNYPENWRKLKAPVLPPKKKGEVEEMKENEDLKKEVLLLKKVIKNMSVTQTNLTNEVAELKNKIPKKFVFFRNGFSFKNWNLKGLWKIVDLYVYVAIGAIVLERLIF